MPLPKGVIQGANSTWVVIGWLQAAGSGMRRASEELFSGVCEAWFRRDGLFMVPLGKALIGSRIGFRDPIA